MMSFLLNVAMDVMAFFVGNVLFMMSLPMLILRRIIYGKRAFDERNMIPSAGRCVVITGCDTGIGKVTATRLLQLGYTVFAGCLDAKNASATTFAEYKASANFHVLQMNVAKQQEVDTSVKYVSDWLDSNPAFRLWAIVNNAGITVFCPFEFISTETLQNVFDVNFFGVVRVTKAFLPLMRRGAHHPRGGRVVIVGGVAGDMPMPLCSYAASKAAGTLLNDVMCTELTLRFGIDVVSVRPDAYATEMFNPDRNVSMFNREVERVRPEVMDAYGGQERVERMRQMISKTMPSMSKKDLSPVVAAVVESVGSRKPMAVYYPIDWKTRALKTLYNISPSVYLRLLEGVPSMSSMVR